MSAFPRRSKLLVLIPSAAPLAGWAQGLSKVNSVMQNVLGVLQSVAALVLAIAIITVGYRMVFHQARWAEVSHIVIGAVLIGSATSIATWLLG